MSDFIPESFKNAIRVDRLRERIAELEHERDQLQETVADLQYELRSAETASLTEIKHIKAM
jgi:predicted  nucleic acid-binding Zn-ribbon protein